MIILEMKNQKQPKYHIYYQTKIGKYEYLAGEEILSSNQKQIIEQTKFTYSHLGKDLAKAIED